MSELIIFDSHNNLFYARRGHWSSEYPDAHLYPSLKKVVIDIEQDRLVSPNIQVIENYGMNNEKVIY
jgi:hypothetical protein